MRGNFMDNGSMDRGRMDPVSLVFNELSKNFESPLPEWGGAGGGAEAGGGASFHKFSYFCTQFFSENQQSAIACNGSIKNIRSWT